MPKTYTMHQAKTNLSRLIEEACEGVEVVIARGKDKQPVAKIVSLGTSQKRRQPGAMAGLLSAEPSAFKPLTPEEVKEWEIE